MTRLVANRLYIAWNGTDYVDESAYLVSASGDVRYAAPYSSLVGGAGITGQMQVTLDNGTGRFSPLYSSGALYANIASGGMYMRRCYLEVSINSGSDYYSVFHGVLKLPGAQSPTWSETSTVTLDVRSRDELLLNRRWSSTQSDFKLYVDGPKTESELMDVWITDPDNGFTVDDLDLDTGLFKVAFPWMDDESLLEEMWLLASACGGRFYADNTGAFRYENMAAWQVETRSTSSQATYTPASWQRLEFMYDDTDLYNEITVEASPRTIGNLDVIWENESTITIQPGQTEVLTARFDAPAYSITGIEHEATDGGGTDLTSSVTITPTYKAQRASLSIANGATRAAYLRMVRILGRPVIGGPEQEATKTSAMDGANSAFFGGRIGRNRRLSGNPYVQTLPQAQALAQRVLDLSEYPRLTFMLTGTPGDPERALGDRITIDHSSIAGFMSSTTTCYVTAIRWMLDSNGFSQDLEAVQTSNVFTYDGSYFVLGTHKPGDSRRVFY